MPRLNTTDRARPGTYHVYNRGRGGRAIFRDDQDREQFLDLVKRELLGHRPEARRLELFAYCLMTTHYHLLLRQRAAGAIADAMHRAVGTYVRYFHRRHGTAGRMFAGAYRSKRVTGRKQFRWTVAYVHANHPTGPAYRFASHNAYLDPNLCSPWLNASAALAVFGGRDAYLDFMEKHAQRARLNELFF